MKVLRFNLNNRKIEIDISRMWAFITIDDFICIDYNYYQYEYDEVFFKYNNSSYTVYDLNYRLNKDNYKLINNILNYYIFKLIENDLKIHELNFNNYDMIKSQVNELRGA